MKRFSNPLLTRLYNRVHVHNKNLIILIIGDTGSGKSYIAVKLAYELDKSFRNAEPEKIIRERVARRPREFASIIKNGNLKKGNAIIFDEAGVGISNREWHTAANKAMGSILQTFRNKNLIAIFTVPSKKYIDKQGRELAHYQVETQSIDYSKKKNIVKFMTCQHNPRYGTTYIKYPQLVVDGKIKKFKRFAFKRAPKEFIDAYEKYSGEFKAEIINEALEKMEQMEREKERSNRVVEVEKIADKIVEKADEYLRDYKNTKTVSVHKICAEFNVGTGYGRRIQALVKKKLDL